MKNYTIEEACNTLKLINKDNKVDIYPIEVEYFNNKNEIEIRKQNIFIISNKKMVKSLSKHVIFY